MVIADGTKNGQRIFLAIFLIIFALLLFGGLISNNINYVYIVLFACLLFSPLYLYNLSFYDIHIIDDFFVISNIINERKIPMSEFLEVIPARKALITLNSPYFTIVFTGNRRFNFIKERSLLQIFENRKGISKKLTEAINEHIRGTKSAVGQMSSGSGKPLFSGQIPPL